MTMTHTREQRLTLHIEALHERIDGLYNLAIAMLIIGVVLGTIIGVIITGEPVWIDQMGALQ